MQGLCWTIHVIWVRDSLGQVAFMHIFRELRFPSILQLNLAQGCSTGGERAHSSVPYHFPKSTWFASLLDLTALWGPFPPQTPSFTRPAPKISRSFPKWSWQSYSLMGTMCCCQRMRLKSRANRSSLSLQAFQLGKMESHISSNWTQR